MASYADPTNSGTTRPVEPPIARSGGRFKAVKRPPRAHRITCPEVNDPYSLFALFFSDEQLQIIADNTNKNARKPPESRQEKRGGGQDLGGLWSRTWIETTIGELYAYLAIMIYMGIHKQNQIRDYWRTDKNRPSHPLVYKSMSLNRFEQLQRFIHVSDPANEGPAHTKVKDLFEICLC